MMAIAKVSTEQTTEQMAEQSPELVVDMPAEAVQTVVASTVRARGTFRVQLGAFKTSRWLSTTLKRLSSKAGDLLPLGRLNVTYEKNLYMVRSMGLEDRAAAARLCKDLQGLEFECFVTRKGDQVSGQAFDIASAGDNTAIRHFVAKLPGNKSVMAIETPAAEPKAVNSTDVGEYRIQLAAYRLARHLDRGMKVLRKAAGGLLPPLESLTRAEAEDQPAIPYRLRSAPMKSRAAAASLCAALKNRGVECLVIRHSAGYWRSLG
jgi:hypothetical protein